MRFLVSVLVSAVMANTLFVSSANASCASEFKRHIKGIVGLSRSVSPTCWSKIKTGKYSTQAKAQSVCPSDMGTVMEMGAKRDQAQQLCQGGDSCQSELKAKGFCVAGKPIEYYLTR